MTAVDPLDFLADQVAEARARYFLGPPALGAINACVDGGALTVNNVYLHTPAFAVTHLTPLFWPPTTRGTNAVLPRVRGTLPRPRRVTETDVSLPIVISGVADRFGNLYDDRMQGLALNLLYLTVNVCTPPDPPQATVPATLELAGEVGIGSSALTADVQVIGMTRGDQDVEIIVGTLDLRIPAGRFR